MKRIVTITDARYRHQVIRLAASLRRNQPDARLVVYCEDTGVRDMLTLWSTVELRALPAIETHGVKRAKFAAFADAAREGPFLYLDADTLVLQCIDELFAIDGFGACADDLGECSFIDDKRFPWAGDPSLENKAYINSGVFVAGPSFLPRLPELAALARDDALWKAYTLEGRLYDNHFLCAWLNKWSVPIHLLDAQVYNWQGLRAGRSLRVVRKGERLVSADDARKTLKIAHFAGTGDVDAFLSAIAPDVAAVLAESGMPPELSWSTPAIPALAALSPHLNRVSSRNGELDVLSACLREINVRACGTSPSSTSRSDSFFSEPERIHYLLGSVPPATDSWNGLACGGPYLVGDEYNFLRDVIARLNARTIIEAGAGETTILFRRMDCDVTAFEAAPGPWLERARASGATIIQAAVDTNGFESARVEEARTSVPVDLVFLDSPPGRVRRQGVLRQFVKAFNPRYVLIHDAWRDIRGLLPIAIAEQLSVVGTHDSVRGFVLLARAGESAFGLSAPLPPVNLTSEDAASVEIEVEEPDIVRRPGARFMVRLTITNRCSVAIASAGDCPVHASYHWVREDGSDLVFDGIRTKLPFAIHPGDVAGFDLVVETPAESGNHVLQVDLVQEGVLWFANGRVPVSRPVTIALDVDARRAD